MAKVGDIVRYLNSVGGGKIVRVKGNIAYVDEDGFETQVLIKDCVVVSENVYDKDNNQNFTNDISKSDVFSQEQDKELPVIETPEGDKLNIVLAYEPRNLLNLSDVHIDTYIVNDSNYYLYFTYSVSKDNLSWDLIYSGIIEPNIQLFLQELDKDLISNMDRILVQVIAFKKGKGFKLKQPLSANLKFDATKFFKRHCFKPNVYFDKDVIAIQLVTDDSPINEGKFHDLKRLSVPHKLADSVKKKDYTTLKRKSRQDDGKIVIDLHITELLDNIQGMSNADILNYQIDEFRRVMDENFKKRGQKIIFIHGKGEGVLRNALLKELNHRYKKHDVQDASFREYGFGATQVTIR